MDLLLRYTETHPAVSAVELALEEVLRRKEQKDKERAGSGMPYVEAMSNPYVQQLKITLNEAETDVASNKARIHYLEQRIKRYKDQLNSSLTVETEMQNLNRDYETISKNYQQLVQRREQAKLSEKVDTETTSIKFKIVDPPRKPLSPSGPKRLLLLSGVLFMGLGAGGALAYLFYYIRPTYVTSRHLRKETGLPVLGAISMQVLDGSKDKQRIFMFVSVMLCMFFVYLGLIVFEYMRLEGIPFSLIRDKLLS